MSCNCLEQRKLKSIAYPWNSACDWMVPWRVGKYCCSSQRTKGKLAIANAPVDVTDSRALDVLEIGRRGRCGFDQGEREQRPD